MPNEKQILQSIVCNSDKDGPEISHIKPLHLHEINQLGGHREKTCWENFVESFKNIFSKKCDDEELHSFALRTETSLNQLKVQIVNDKQHSKDDYLKLKKVFATMTSIGEMTDLLKECVLSLTFTKYSTVSFDEKNLSFMKGKTIIGLYVWMCAFCLHTSQEKDINFWTYFGVIVDKSTLLWLQMTNILSALENLRDVAAHIVRQMENHTFIVPLNKVAGKYRRKQEELKEMKKFDSYKSELAWDSNLSEPLHFRLLYAKIDCKKLNSANHIRWNSFELLNSTTQSNVQQVLMQYIETLLNEVLKIQSKIKLSSVLLDKSVNLQPNLEADVILGMIMLDKLDTLTLAAKTLKQYVLEVRSIIHICYEFSRFNNGMPNTVSYAELVHQKTSDIHNSFNFEETQLTVREAHMKFNTQSYQDVLRTFPVKTTNFTLILQDLGDVFDTDSMSDKSLHSTIRRLSATHTK